jgi:hypothetical protein
MTSRLGWPFLSKDYPVGAEVGEAAAVAATLPSGLASELPDDFAEATGAPQFSDRSTWLTGEALVFSGAGSVLPCCRVTMQFDRSTVSPTVVDTTTDKPAEDSCDEASLYF